MTIDRLNPIQALRFLLYPVVFAPDPIAEIHRVSQLFGDRPQMELAALIQGARMALAQSVLQVDQIEPLVSKPTEAQLRVFLESVVGELEAELLRRSGI